MGNIIFDHAVQVAGKAPKQNGAVYFARNQIVEECGIVRRAGGGDGESVFHHIPVPGSLRMHAGNDFGKKWISENVAGGGQNAADGMTADFAFILRAVNQHTRSLVGHVLHFVDDFPNLFRRCGAGLFRRIIVQNARNG